jgi:hypothetical protein
MAEHPAQYDLSSIKETQSDSWTLWTLEEQGLLQITASASFRSYTL